MKTKLVSAVIVSRDRKKDLVECLNSYENQSYKYLEIIVVDNASRPPLLTWLPRKFKNVKLITSETNLGAAQGRNIGLSQAKGDYILFTDDDAYADKNMVKYLVSVFENYKKAGIVQPLVYDKKKKSVLQGAGHDVNLTTGRITAWGVQEVDEGQYDGVREIPMCGCVWIVKKETFQKIGNYDEDYFIPYEDSDFSIRARKAGFKLYCYSKAKSWHQGVKKTFVNPRIEWLGITSPERAFRVARNKIIFMRKHSPFPNNLFFFFVLEPIYIVGHSLIIISSLRFDILEKYWLGLLSGIFYLITYPFKKVEKYLNKFDERLSFLKLFLIAWTEPIGWLIDKKAKTILDVGSGQGIPMQLIKRRMRLKYSVGIDLFEPYIEETRAKNIHDRYIIGDVRKMSFKDKSFDVVIALQVLEHLSKRQALQVLKKMEKIAKRQVIIATPIGEMYHAVTDNNPLQLHKSEFLVADFERLGYKVMKFGRKGLLGETGLVHKTNNDVIRKILFLINFVITPIYYLFPDFNDYHLYAYKKLNE